MDSLIAPNSEFTFDEKHSILSLVRDAKGFKDHAYLILERLKNGVKDKRREDIAIHLKIKTGRQNKKAIIQSYEIDIRKLESIAQHQTAICYRINKEEERQLFELVENEKQRGDDDKINYQQMGKSQINGLLGKILVEHGSVASKDFLENKSGNNSSMDSLLRDSHNCISWCYAMLEALGLKTPHNPTHLVVMVPSVDIKAKLQNGHELRPSRCVIM